LRPSDFSTLTNGICDLAGFAQTNPDFSALITYDNKSTEIETASAFHNFGGAIDKHDLLD
jgi:hypothetical protein